MTINFHAERVMLALVVACLFLLAIGLVLRSREHLTPQGNIQAPAGLSVQDGYRTYSPEQENQIWAIIPESSRVFMRKPHINNPEPGAMERNAKRDAAWMIAIFYKDVYAPANSPITPTNVDDWMKSESIDGYPEYRKMMIAYFIDGAPPPAPASGVQAASPPPAAETSPAPASTSSPTTSTPAPANQTIDVVSPSTITINVRAAT